MPLNRPTNATREISINALAVTDTALKTGSTIDISDCVDYLLGVTNTLNQAGNLQVQYSIDNGGTWVNLGTAVPAAATTSFTSTIAAPKPFFGLIRIQYTATLAPASGTITATIHKRYS